MDDLISRQETIDIINTYAVPIHGYIGTPNDSEVYAYARGLLLSIERNMRALPSAEPEISRIEQELHGKTPEEQYEFLYWLMLKFALTYTDSRLAVIDWLKGEK